MGRCGETSTRVRTRNVNEKKQVLFPLQSIQHEHAWQWNVQRPFVRQTKESTKGNSMISVLFQLNHNQEHNEIILASHSHCSSNQQNAQSNFEFFESSFMKTKSVLYWTQCVQFKCSIQIHALWVIFWWCPVIIYNSWIDFRWHWFQRLRCVHNFDSIWLIVWCGWV